MKINGSIGNNKGSKNNANSKNNSHNNGFLPCSLKFISSCLKTASSGVRSASASVADSISGNDRERQKDQYSMQVVNQLLTILMAIAHLRDEGISVPLILRRLHNLYVHFP